MESHSSYNEKAPGAQYVLISEETFEQQQQSIQPYKPWSARKKTVMALSSVALLGLSYYLGSIASRGSSSSTTATSLARSNIASVPVVAWENCTIGVDSCASGFKCCIGPLDLDIKKSTCRYSDPAYINKVDGCHSSIASASKTVPAWNDCTASVDTCESGFKCCIGPLDSSIGKYTCRKEASEFLDQTQGCSSTTSTSSGSSAGSDPIDAWNNCDVKVDTCVDDFKCCIGPLDYGIQKYTCRQSSSAFTNKPDGCYVPSAKSDVEAWNDCTPKVDTCVYGYDCCIGPVDLDIKKYTCRSTAKQYLNKTEGCYVAPAVTSSSTSIASSTGSVLSSATSTAASSTTSAATSSSSTVVSSSASVASVASSTSTAVSSSSVVSSASATSSSSAASSPTTIKAEVVCDKDSNPASKNSETAIEVTFTNEFASTSPASYDLCWIDSSGKAVYKATLNKAHPSSVQQTYLNHPWVLMPPTGSCSAEPLKGAVIEFKSTTTDFDPNFGKLGIHDFFATCGN